MELNVEIESEETWPKQFREEAKSYKELVISYQLEYNRINRLFEKDVLATVNPPYNQYQDDYSQLLDRLEDILSKHRIVAYHCTRLTTREINNIKDYGMEILTEDLVKRRLENAFYDKVLTKKQVSYLSNSDIIKSNLDNKYGGRTGMIWCCPNRSSLKKESGVYRLFRSWGGEAVYRGYEGDDGIFPSFQGVGTPCIIKCAIPVPDTNHFTEKLTERFLSHFVTDSLEYPEPPPTFDMYVRRNLFPTEILDIIEITNPEFEYLTSYMNWSENI